MKNNVRNDLRRVEGDFKRSSSRMAKMAKVFSGVLAAAFAIKVAVDFGGEMFTIARSIESVDQKSTAVFEGSRKIITKWAEENARSFGLTTLELEGAAAGFGDLLKPMGFTARETANLTTDTLGLAGALSEWTDGKYTAEEASGILAKAMLGNREQLKELGIAINQSDVDARLAANGQEKLTGKAKKMATVIATQELIFEATTDAQKAFADGGGTLERKTGELRSTFVTLKENIARALIPVFYRVIGILEDLGIVTKDTSGMTKRQAEVVETSVTKQKKKFDELLAKVKKVLSDNSIRRDKHGETVIIILGDLWQVVKSVWKIIVGIFQAALGLIRGDFKTFSAGVSKIWQALYAFINRMADGKLAEIGKKIRDFKNSAMRVWRGFKDGVVGVWRSIRSTVAGLASSMAEKIGNSINKAIRFLNSLITAFNRISGKFGGPQISGLDSINTNAYNNKSANNRFAARYSAGFATGGQVGGSGTGDTVPAMLTPGEFVLRADAVRRIGTKYLSHLNAGGRPDGFAKGGLVALGHWLQNKGARVGEHPAFGGVNAVHTSGSYHYRGDAIDANYGPGGQNSTEMAFFDRIVPQIRSGLFGNFKEILWRVAGHYNHLHVGGSGGGTMGGGGIGFVDILKKLWDRAIANAKSRMGDSTIGKLGAGAIGKLAPAGLEALRASVFDNGGTLGPGFNLVNNRTGMPEHLVPAGAGGGGAIHNYNFERRDRDATEISRAIAWKQKVKGI